MLHRNLQHHNPAGGSFGPADIMPWSVPPPKLGDPDSELELIPIIPNPPDPDPKDPTEYVKPAATQKHAKLPAYLAHVIYFYLTHNYI